MDSSEHDCHVSLSAPLLSCYCTLYCSCTSATCNARAHPWGWECPANQRINQPCNRTNLLVGTLDVIFYIGRTRNSYLLLAVLRMLPQEAGIPTAQYITYQQSGNHLKPLPVQTPVYKTGERYRCIERPVGRPRPVPHLRSRGMDSTDSSGPREHDRSTLVAPAVA